MDHHSLFAERFKLLKTSLSEALAHFYPFAGVFEYNVSISCNDHGAAFLEAQVNCLILNILDKPDFEILNQLIPTDIGSTQAEVGHLLLVQANLFQCGEMTIGISISHKVADASTLNTFIKSWAEIALGSFSTTTTTTDHVVLAVEFSVAASLSPPLDFVNSPKVALTCSKEKCITRRFLFAASRIATLKSKAASTTYGASMPNPTRVEVVSAFIWKCVTAASRSNLGFVKSSVLYTIVNMRKRSTQALTEKYTCRSWCRFSLYEAANFGWGKPSWVSSWNFEFYSRIQLLMDMRDGDGIEALLTLKQEDMAMIESNKDLFAYASPNPSAS